MWKNYFKLSIRNILKYKTTSLINIMGLSLGLAVTILIFVYIKHEKSYDRWLEGSEQTYRVIRSWDNGGQSAWTPSLLAAKLMDEYPEVEIASGLGLQGETLIEYEGKKIYVKDIASVDSTFFSVLKLPFIAGDPKKSLNQPKSLVISSDLAETLFGSENPLGKIVAFDTEPGFMITGIFDLRQKNSHLDYSIYTPFTWHSEFWSGNNRATYLRLNKEAQVKPLAEKITTSLNELIKREYESNNYPTANMDFANWELQPVQQIHLNSSGIGWLGGGGGDQKTLYIFSIIALLVLIIAIINYVNLATAQSTNRAKEVGVRKVTGAGKKQLVFQFLSESVIQALTAAVLGLILANLLLPIFEIVIARDLSFLTAENLWQILTFTFFLALLIGLLAGIYPALILASYKPSSVLSGRSWIKQGKGIFRKVLVTSQFTITLCLLVVMAFIYKQVNFMLAYDLGFEARQVITITTNLPETHSKVETLRNQFLKIPGVEDITTASRMPGMSFPDWAMQEEGQDKNLNPRVLHVDEHYLSTLNIPLKAGRFFSSKVAGDSLNNYVVNEAFVKQYGIANPLTTRIKFSSDQEFGKIIGVVQDFHFQGLNIPIRPLVMTGLPQRYISGIKVATSDLDQTISAIKNLWASIEPNHPIRMAFLDDEFAAQYSEQKRFGRSLLYATILTLFIAFLGLFGLTTFAIQQRFKEIGIRKMLGASAEGIVALFTKDFIYLVIIAFIIGVPISYYFTNLWLEDYDTRIDIDAGVFIWAFLGMLFLTVITVGIRALRAALVNPIHSIRN